MLQMRERGYADKFWTHEKPIHLIAAVCGKAEQNLVSISVETA